MVVDYQSSPIVETDIYGFSLEDTNDPFQIQPSGLRGLNSLPTHFEPPSPSPAPLASSSHDVPPPYQSQPRPSQAHPGQSRQPPSLPWPFTTPAEREPPPSHPHHPPFDGSHPGGQSGPPQICPWRGNIGSPGPTRPQPTRPNWTSPGASPGPSQAGSGPIPGSHLRPRSQQETQPTPGPSQSSGQLQSIPGPSQSRKAGRQLIPFINGLYQLIKLEIPLPSIRKQTALGNFWP